MSVAIGRMGSGGLSKRILGNMNGSHSPGLAIITGCHVSSDTFTLCHGVDIIGISSIQDKLGVSPRYTRVEDALASSLKKIKAFQYIQRLTMSAYSSAVVFSTLYRATPTLGFAVTGRECRYSFAVDRNRLGIVSAIAVEFICGKNF